MRAWRVHEWGEPSDVLVLDDIDTPEPGPGEVLIRNQAVPLNLNDIDRVNGANMMAVPELPVTPGMEVMGTVEAVGDGVGLAVGERVVATAKQATGGWAEATLCPAPATFPMPDDIALPDAAALLFPFHLALLGLVDRASVQTGETVLVHAGAGGAGSAAIQVAVERGATVIATCSTQAKADVCRSFGASAVIDYTEEDLAAAVLEHTDGRGVDVVFDTVGESVFEDSLKATAYNGRYVMIGFASDKPKADEPIIVPRRIITANIHLSGVLLTYAPDELIPLVKQGLGWNFASTSIGNAMHDQLVAGVRSGAFRANVGRVVDFDQIPAEIEALADRSTIGRTVVTLPAS